MPIDNAGNYWAGSNCLFLSSDSKSLITQKNPKGGPLVIDSKGDLTLKAGASIAASGSVIEVRCGTPPSGLSPGVSDGATQVASLDASGTLTFGKGLRLNGPSQHIRSSHHIELIAHKVPLPPEVWNTTGTHGGGAVRFQKYARMALVAGMGAHPAGRGRIDFILEGQSVVLVNLRGTVVKRSLHCKKLADASVGKGIVTRVVSHVSQLEPDAPDGALAVLEDGADRLLCFRTPVGWQGLSLQPS